MTWTGKHHKGASAIRKAVKREEAEARNALTPVERTKAFRHGRAA